MSIRDDVHEAMTAAMRSGDHARRDALRMAWNAITGAEKRDRATLTDEAAIAVLARELKTRRESLEAFTAGGRRDLAAPEEAAIAVIEEFLPRPLSEDELAALVAEAIAASGATSPREMGKAMAWLSPRIRGRADGRHASELVTRALADSAAPGPAVAGTPASRGSAKGAAG